MILPVPAWPLKEQSGFGQQRDLLLLRFIHLLMTENNQEIQVGSCVARLLEKVNNTSLKKHHTAYQSDTITDTVEKSGTGGSS